MDYSDSLESYGNYSIMAEDGDHEDFFAAMVDPWPIKIAHTLSVLIIEAVGNNFVFLLVAYNRSRPEVEQTLLNYISTMFFVVQCVLCNVVGNLVSLLRVWLGPTAVQIAKLYTQFTQVATIFNMMTILVRGKE